MKKGILITTWVIITIALIILSSINIKWSVIAAISFISLIVYILLDLKDRIYK
jgi:hypothetical protein